MLIFAQGKRKLENEKVAIESGVLYIIFIVFFLVVLSSVNLPCSNLSVVPTATLNSSHFRATKGQRDDQHHLTETCMLTTGNGWAQ